jgi:hypothetical protein
LIQVGRKAGMRIETLGAAGTVNSLVGERQIVYTFLLHR